VTGIEEGELKMENKTGVSLNFARPVSVPRGGDKAAHRENTRDQEFRSVRKASLGGSGNLVIQHQGSDWVDAREQKKNIFRTTGKIRQAQAGKFNRSCNGSCRMGNGKKKGVVPWAQGAAGHVPTWRPNRILAQLEKR